MFMSKGTRIAVNASVGILLCVVLAVMGVRDTSAYAASLVSGYFIGSFFTSSSKIRKDD
jgi:hypothetical protein